MKHMFNHRREDRNLSCGLKPSLRGFRVSRVSGVTRRHDLKPDTCNACPACICSLSWASALDSAATGLYRFGTGSDRIVRLLPDALLVEWLRNAWHRCSRRPLLRHLATAGGRCGLFAAVLHLEVRDQIRSGGRRNGVPRQTFSGLVVCSFASGSRCPPLAP